MCSSPGFHYMSRARTNIRDVSTLSEGQSPGMSGGRHSRLPLPMNPRALQTGTAEAQARGDMHQHGHRAWPAAASPRFVLSQGAAPPPQPHRRPGSAAGAFSRARLKAGAELGPSSVSARAGGRGRDGLRAGRAEGGTGRGRPRSPSLRVAPPGGRRRSRTRLLRPRPLRDRWRQLGALGPGPAWTDGEGQRRREEGALHLG